MLAITSVTIAVVFATFCLYKFRAGLRAVNDVPGIRSLFSPLSPLGAALPCVSWNPGHEWTWHWRKTAYFDYTHDVISAVPIVLGSPSIYISSLDVAKQLLNTQATRLEKPREISSALQWGDNVTTVNGDLWRIHRRIVAPSFTQKMYQDVWVSVRKTYLVFMENGDWRHSPKVDVPKLHAMILDLAMTVICSCGFGLDVDKANASDDPLRQAFPDDLRTVSETWLPHLLIPKWAYSLPIDSIQRVKNAWSATEAYILTILRKRKEEDPDPAMLNEQDVSGHILNRLVSAWASEDRYTLSEQEVLSDVYAIVFAGHETTASGLATTLVCLSLYPDIQQTVFEEIAKIVHETGLSQHVDPNRLSYTWCCFLEALRLVPSALVLARRATEDIVLHVTHPAPGTVVVNKGTVIMNDLVGLSYNPHNFDDPEEFRPERWAHHTDHDILMFGLGHRACIGRRFAQAEVQCFLASLLYDWKVEPLLAPGESREQYAERVLGKASLAGTALALKETPVRFVRRGQ